MVADGRTCFAWCNCKPFLNVSLNFSGHVIMCMDDDALHLQGQPDREGGRKEGGPDSRRSNGRTGQLFGYVPSTRGVVLARRMYGKVSVCHVPTVWCELACNS